jgi:uncharacterized protein (DUF58 family)
MIPLKQRKPYQLPRDAFEYAVIIAASLADYFTRTRRALGFAALGRRLVILPAEKGERQLYKILTELSTLEDEGRKSLQQLMEGQVKNISRGSLAVIITPREIDAIQENISLAERWGIRTKVVQVIPGSFGIDKNTSQNEITTLPNGILLNQQALRQDQGTAQGSLFRNKKDLIRIAYGDEISAKLG